MKTGNYEEDQSKEVEADMFQQIIDTLCEEPKHIVPTYNFVSKRVKALPDNSSSVPAETFNELSVLGRIPDDFKLQWLTEHSDLIARDIVQLMKHDAQAANYLIQYATKVQMKFRLPARFKTKEVLKRFLDARYELCGERLGAFKKREACATPLPLTSSGAAPTASSSWRACSPRSSTTAPVIELLYQPKPS